MSILIKGMKMPKNCFDCPCYRHKVDNGYYDYEICRASGTVFNDGYSSVTGHKDHIDPFKARLDNCPLVSVPPHGDLIERDNALACVSCDLSKKDYNVSYQGFCIEMAFRLINAPTVIEAEEDKS